jgi:peptide deformylase
MSIAIITDMDVLRSVNKKADMLEAAEIIRELEQSLNNSPEPGVGLAAPQIGINKRVAIVRIDERQSGLHKRAESLDLVNPVITKRDKGFVNFDERCLSLPGTSINTNRYKEIFIKDDIHPEGFVATGYMALVLQHECDHLDGVLIVDRVVSKKKMGRNDPCPCGKKINNKPVKYKKCCYGR